VLAVGGCGGLTLAGHQVLTKPALSTLYLSKPSSTGQRRENTTKGSWVKIRRGRDHSPITIMGKTHLTWGNQFNLSPTKSEQDNEKIKAKS